MKKNLLLLVLAFPLLFSLDSFGQQGFELDPLIAKKARGAIVIDGVLDEEDWNLALPTDEFFQYYPADTSMAEAQTQVRITYDENFIYVGAIMQNKGPRSYVSTSLRRDFRGEQNDGFTIVFDTFLDRTNAYTFGVNPYGVQREGLVANGGLGPADLSLAWDNIWFAEAKIYDGYWIAEIAIPFKSIRFSENSTKWNANFYRMDSEYNERSTWAPIPKNYSMIGLAFAREIHWENPLPSPGSNISLIPYAAGGISKNYLEETPTNRNFSMGGDAKVAIGPALNLDLTFNPDFSQVEVDQQVTNLDRFEIFFPERRQFFLENADLFSDFGMSRARPFFSRRIGVDRDENTGQNIQNRIILGGRVSGKIDNNWRVGLLNMQTDKIPESGVESKNYTVAAVQRKVFGRSNIGLIMVNQESFDLNTSNNYNRLVGLDYNLASIDNKWSGKFFFHKSIEHENPDNSFAAHGRLLYDDLNWTASLTYTKVGENYNPEVGYTPRTNFSQASPQIGYRWFPKSTLINRHGPTVNLDFIWNQEYGMTDQDHSISYNVQFQSLASFSVSANNTYTYLFFSFDPTNTGGERLAAGSDYQNWMYNISFRSNFRLPFSYSINGSTGEYYNGTRDNLRASVNWRFGYSGTISLDANYNKLRLPEPYNDADLFLIGPKFDFTFSRSVFWTTFVQYNNQIDNVNINTRFQWRYRPVSDLFIVYTDNYFPDQWMSKNRALVLKMTYWLNM